jgi:hypothetical protein
VALAGDVVAQPTCPPVGAEVAVFVENLSGDPGVAVTLGGELLDPEATCDGGGRSAYAATLTCSGAGLVECGSIPDLHPGAWVNHLAVTVTGSSPQAQHARAVFVAGGFASNVLVWTVYPRTLVVADATEATLRAALAAASPGPALVTFSPAVFPGADASRTIDLGSGPCPPGHQAAVCFTGSGIVVDALDARGRPGGVRLSVGAQPIPVLKVFGSDNVFRGLVLDGSGTPPPTMQADTVAFTGAAAQRNRIEQSIVHGPMMGDAVSADAGAGVGAGAGDTNAVEGCEVTGARDKGVKVTTGAHLTVRRSCLHDNLNGGVQATLGGHVVAVENVIQHNVPGASQNGIAVRGLSPCLAVPTYPDCDEPSTGATEGNIVRFHGGRGLTATDNAVASFADDYVADNQIIGSKVESTTRDPGTAAAPAGAVPVASFRGVALVCNRNAGVSGTCQPQVGSDGTACGTDADCCGLADGCCVTDPGCAAPLRCDPISSVQGFGASQAQADGKPAPQVDYGSPSEPGRNAFAWNRNAPGGINFNVNVVQLAVPAEGNQWEHCGTGATCDTGMVLSSDVLLAAGATVALGTPAGPRAGVPVLGSASPPRPRRGELVRVYGDNFNAIEGTACAHDVAPTDACSGENPSVQDQNRLMGVNAITILDAGGHDLAAVWPDAVTPTMLAFRMPFDCFAPLVLRVAKRDPGGSVVSGTIALCDPGGCGGQPAGHPCDDGNACTTGDRCDGNGTCQPGEARACRGGCLTGACEPATGCVPKPAGAACEDGDACTTGDHCSGQDDVCLPGPPRVCHGACLDGTCDPGAGCRPRPANTVCEDGDPCTVGDHCAGDRDVCVPGSAACDDGDPCTDGDVCSAGVCRGVSMRGFDGAICQVRKRLIAPVCAWDPGGGRLERFTGNRFHTAELLLRRAAGTPKLATRDRLLRRASAALQAVDRRAMRYKRQRKISAECAAAVRKAVSERRHLVADLIL